MTPHSMASTRLKSLTIQGNGDPSGYPLPWMWNGVADRSTQASMPQAELMRSSPSTQTVAASRPARSSADRASPPAGAGRYAWWPSSFSTSSGPPSQRSPRRLRANASGVSSPSRPTAAPPTVTVSGAGPSRCQLTTSTLPAARAGRSADGTTSNRS